MDQPKINSPSFDPEECFQHCRLACAEAIFSTDSRGFLNSFNQGAQELFGYLQIEVIGKPLRDFMRGGDAEFQRIVETLKGLGSPHAFETVMIGKGQREIPVKLSASLIGDDGDNPPYGLIAISHDLSQIRSLETELLKKDQFFSSILKNSADAIFTLDPNETITSWNKGAEAIFGYSEEEMLGQSLQVLMPQHLVDQKELEKIAGIAISEGFLRSYQTQRVTKDSSLIDVLFTRTAIRDNQEKLIGFSSVLKDVTEQKLIDRHLAQMEKLSAIGELAAGLAHEIKNPLAGIKGAIEIIRDTLSKDNIHRNILGEVLSEVGRIDRSVNHLLSYSKPNKPDFVRIHLVGLIKNVISFLQKVADSQGVQLHLQQNGDIPLIIGDENELRQLFMNLILNSLEALEAQGQVWVKVKIIGDSLLHVEVVDNGPGIPSENLSRVFQPFFTSKKDGTGLGLATCKRIVLDHGGEIRVESALGKGARFLIDLPLGSIVPMSLSNR